MSEAMHPQRYVPFQLFNHSLIFFKKHFFFSGYHFLPLYFFQCKLFGPSIFSTYFSILSYFLHIFRYIQHVFLLLSFPVIYFALYFLFSATNISSWQNKHSRTQKEPRPQHTHQDRLLTREHFRQGRSGTRSGGNKQRSVTQRPLAQHSHKCAT